MSATIILLDSSKRRITSLNGIIILVDVSNIILSAKQIKLVVIIKDPLIDILKLLWVAVNCTGESQSIKNKKEDNFLPKTRIFSSCGILKVFLICSILLSSSMSLRFLPLSDTLEGLSKDPDAVRVLLLAGVDVELDELLLVTTNSFSIVVSAENSNCSIAFLQHCSRILYISSRLPNVPK